MTANATCPQCGKQIHAFGGEKVLFEPLPEAR